MQVASSQICTSAAWEPLDALIGITLLTGVDIAGESLAGSLENSSEKELLCVIKESLLVLESRP